MIVVPFVFLSLLSCTAEAFSVYPSVARWTTILSATPSFSTAIHQHPFIDDELRGAAMKLHTREQAPKEGKMEAPAIKPYTPNLDDYLAFLVDSQHVYATMEEIVNKTPELAVLRNTGLERTIPLENDIKYLVDTYKLERPAVGNAGTTYAEVLRSSSLKSIPAFVCHFYNHYFAHTAGGRMIGKKMSSLLLNGTTLDFYKWENGNLNNMKEAVKDSIEGMAERWSNEEREECVHATAAAFEGGGSLNSYLMRGKR